MTTPYGASNYTLAQAQSDIANLRGQVAHLLAYAEILQVVVDTKLTGPDASVWSLSGIALASGKFITTADTWQTVTPNAGWALGSNDGTCFNLSYRFAADGLVHIMGSIHSTSTTPNATFFTLASAYRPSSNIRLSLVEATATAAFANFAGVSTTGMVSPFLVTTASGTDYHFDNFYKLS